MVTLAISVPFQLWGDARLFPTGAYLAVSPGCLPRVPGGASWCMESVCPFSTRSREEARQQQKYYCYQLLSHPVSSH